VTRTEDPARLDSVECHIEDALTSQLTMINLLSMLLTGFKPIHQPTNDFMNRD
jgi:hypothetical protein